MDIKDLDKKQLILLTLLITFVVSIATGIITVSLMKQMPTTVPQTINNVIQRTIEKVTTVESVDDKSDSTTDEDKDSKNNNLILGDGDTLVPIYLKDGLLDSNLEIDPNSLKEIGQGVIISDVGLIMVDSSILSGVDSYIITLNKIHFNASVLKTFTNGFSILKIIPEEVIDEKNVDLKEEVPSSDTTVDSTI